MEKETITDPTSYMGVEFTWEPDREHNNWLMSEDSGFSGVTTRSQFFDTPFLLDSYLTAHAANDPNNPERAEANQRILKAWGLKPDDVFELFQSLENDISWLNE